MIFRESTISKSSYNYWHTNNNCLQTRATDDRTMRCSIISVGASGLVVRVLDFHTGSSILTAGHLQTTFSKLRSYCVLRSTQPPTLSGKRNE